LEHSCFFLFFLGMSLWCFLFIFFYCCVGFMLFPYPPPTALKV
jgi:hypothetical protein